ncbi:MAG: hypothetical protein MHPSP_003529 [Paramarteilia canceri]
MNINLIFDSNRLIQLKKDKKTSFPYELNTGFEAIMKIAGEKNNTLAILNCVLLFNFVGDMYHSELYIDEMLSSPEKFKNLSVHAICCFTICFLKLKNFDKSPKSYRKNDTEFIKSLLQNHQFQSEGNGSKIAMALYMVLIEDHEKWHLQILSENYLFSECQELYRKVLKMTGKILTIEESIDILSFFAEYCFKKGNFYLAIKTYSELWQLQKSILWNEALLHAATYFFFSKFDEQNKIFKIDKYNTSINSDRNEEILNEVVQILENSCDKNCRDLIKIAFDITNESKS